MITRQWKRWGKTENRYSGIPTIRYAMKSLSLPEPVFSSMNGSFRVTLYNSTSVAHSHEDTGGKRKYSTGDGKGLVDFCRTPGSRDEIIRHIGITSGEYSLRRYLEPLIRDGRIALEIPSSPRSRKQKYVTVE